MMGVEEEVDASLDEEAGVRGGRLVPCTIWERVQCYHLADDWQF